MKTVVIYHSVDPDGWMSAAIVKHWFLSQESNKFNNHFTFDLSKTNNPYGKNCPSVETLDFIGYNYGQPIPDLSKYDKVILVDISFPAEIMWNIQNRIGYENFVWIDHHISAINDINNYYREHALGNIGGLRDTKFAACELTWMYFFPNERMPEIVRLLGRYDCFGHKGTDEETKVLEFQYGARSCISNYEEAYQQLLSNIRELAPNSTVSNIWSKGIAVYDYLCTEAKQIYASKFDLYFNMIHIGRGTTRQDSQFKFAAINRNRFNPINFGIDYHKDGYDGVASFYFDGKQFNYSLYNDNGLVDCSAIAKHYGGGGHMGAAGFISDKMIL